MWAIVPIKDFTDAKGRLSEVLTPPERESLARAMFRDVLDTLSRTKGLDGIAVMTRDVDAQGLCADLGFRVLTEERNEGQTTAVMSASQSLRQEGIEGVLTIPGDVPLVSPKDIEIVMEKHLAAPAMTIVPARDYQGSNCIICSPPGFVPLRFGENSFYPHLDAARQLGITPVIVELPNLALDIDTPEDLEFLAGEPVRTRAQAYLLETDIVDRIYGPAVGPSYEVPKEAVGGAK
jgi:2-phospho-L-lactate guanylyltransferase